MGGGEAFSYGEEQNDDGDWGVQFSPVRTTGLQDPGDNYNDDDDTDEEDGDYEEEDDERFGDLTILTTSILFSFCCCCCFALQPFIEKFANVS